MKVLLFVAQCAWSGTKVFVLDGMDLRWSEGLFLALGLVTMFSAFGVFAKKLMRRCSSRQVMVVPFVEMKGTTTPDRFEHRHTSSTVATPVFVLKWYIAPWTSDVVLNFLLVCIMSWEASPPPSTIWSAEVDSRWSIYYLTFASWRRCSYFVYLGHYYFLARLAFSLFYQCFPD
jgi:hypothetical protein